MIGKCLIHKQRKRFKIPLPQNRYNEKGLAGLNKSHFLKVAEHNVQVPMPNSLLLLNYLCFGVRFLQESRLTRKGFILAFWLQCLLLPWQRSWLKTRLKTMVFVYSKKIQSLDFFRLYPVRIVIESLLSTMF